MVSRISIWSLFLSCMKIHVSSIICGNITFQPDSVPLGGSIGLVFTPTRQFSASRRLWLRLTSASAVYDSLTSQAQPSKFVETAGPQTNSYTLTFDVTYDDIGKYMVRFNHGNTHVCDSRYATLAVKPAPVKQCGEISVTKSIVSVGEMLSFTYLHYGAETIVWQKIVNEDIVNIQNGGRFTVSPKVNQMKTFLFIDQTNAADSGDYRAQCMHGYSNSISIKIVATPPSKPIFKNTKDIYNCQNCLAAYKGREMKVSCMTKNGSKPISLNMYKNGDLLPNSHTIEQNEELVAEYRFTPSDNDINTYFTCKVNNSALTEPEVTHVLLYLYITPEDVKLNIPSTIVEQEPQTIQCSTFKGRPPFMPDFYFNSKKLNSTKKRHPVVTGDTFTVHTTTTLSFSRSDNGGSFMCGISTKYITALSDTQTVHVLFPPLDATLLEQSKYNKADGETRLVLRLDVQVSNPVSDVEWRGLEQLLPTFTRQISNDSETKGQSLSVVVTLNLSRADNNREIKAIAINKAFPDMYVSASYKTDIRYAPVVVISGSDGDTLSVYEGDDVLLVCDVDSNPLSTVSWYNQSGLIKMASQQKKLNLQLLNVSLDLAETYTCLARNNLGTSNKSLILVVKDLSEKPMMSTDNSVGHTGPIVGGVLLVVVALLGALVCFLIRKHRTETGGGMDHVQIKVEERKPSARPSINEPVYSNIDKQDKTTNAELTVYASVIPKHQRPVAEEKDNEVPKSGYRNEDGLLYADLDLHHDSESSANKPIIKTEESTQYVTVDFSKTGTIEIHNIPDETGVPE